MDSYLKLSGHPTWKFITWSKIKDYNEMQLKTYFLQECFAEGLLVLNSNNVTLSHTSRIVNKALDKYEVVLSRIAKSIQKKSLLENLKVDPLQALFKVR